VPRHLLRMPPTDFRRLSGGMFAGLSAAWSEKSALMPCA